MHRGFLSTLGLGLIFTCCTLLTVPAFAGKVMKVKGKSVIIKISGKEKGNVMVGDTLYLTRKGKRRAIVKVKKVKGAKVLGVVTKGKAKKGYRTKLKTAKKKKKRQRIESVADSEDGSVVQDEGSAESGELRFGVLGGYGIASQSVTQTTGTSEQAGSSIAAKAIVDYSLFGDIGARANIGAEIFSVTGEGTNFVSQTNDPNIGTDITYLTIDILLRYRFMLSSSIFGHLNAGLGIWSPLSKETTTLDPNSVSTTSVMIFGGAIGIPVGSMDVFFGADYYYFPPSEDVTTNVISAKFGLLFDL